MPNSQFPTWNDELYLEFHRGCYTSHADQKRWNRRCEGLLYEAELYSALASLVAGTAYPKAELEEAWKKILFNQFHDILPGSSIPEVYIDADRAWLEVEQAGTEILERAIEAIAAKVLENKVLEDIEQKTTTASAPAFEARPIVIFNSLNWSRSQVVAIDLPAPAPSGKQWQICDIEGKKLRSQLQSQTLLFHATDIPAIGYRLFWLILQDLRTESMCRVRNAHQTLYVENDPTICVSHLMVEDAAKALPNQDVSPLLMENECLRVEVDRETGNLSSVYDKINQREVLSGQGNQLQVFQDSGQYWDAWNIDPNYEQYPLPAPVVKEIQCLENGPVQWRSRVVRLLGNSQFVQDYILEADSPVLKIATTVDWQERHVMVKAAFPLQEGADYATYEIPCGAIERTTKPQTVAEKAKWEVPALRWADISSPGSEDCNAPSPESNPSYGVSLLNDCKYGYDAQPHQLRLTLLRGSTWPDPEADLGFHEFTYALYPHAGNWQSAHTVRCGYELNLPLRLLVGKTEAVRPNQEIKNKVLAASGSLLDLSAENLILMAFKQSEDDPDRWIMRCYECCGREAELTLRSDLGLAIVEPVDLLEQPAPMPESLPESKAYKIPAWKVASFVVV